MQCKREMDQKPALQKAGKSRNSEVAYAGTRSIGRSVAELINNRELES